MLSDRHDLGATGSTPVEVSALTRHLGATVNAPVECRLLRDTAISVTETATGVATARGTVYQRHGVLE